MNIKLNRKNLLNATWIIILCAAWFGIGWVASVRLAGSNVKLVKAAHQLIMNDSLFNQQSDRELEYAAIRGMLSKVNDPYAELIEPAAAQDLIDTFAGKTGVIGMYAENQDGQVVILIVFPGGSAESAGLLAGDVILSIDGIPLDKDADSSETGLLIRGAPGTTVHLEILREGKVLEFDIQRHERVFVNSRMLSGSIGYISLNAFNAVASQQMKQNLKSLLEQKPTALIWDLRNNEGGDMQAAQEILSYFIGDGLLFSAQLTQDRIVQFLPKGDAFASQIPLVVLIDHTTYSASETAAATIAETGRGRTVGSNTYGKGLIQATLPIGDDTLLQMTIAKWLSPNNEWYHERGVAPQIPIIDDPSTEADEVLDQAVQFLLSSP